MRVIYFSSIIEPDGRATDVQFYSGKRTAYPKSKYTWPLQSNPSNTAWKTWNNILKTILNIPKKWTLPKNGNFPPHHTLQQWLTTTNKKHIQQEWYHDAKSEELYNNKVTDIIQYFSKEITYLTLQCSMISKIKTNVILQRATSIKQRDNKFICYPQHNLENTPFTIPLTLKQHINNLPEWKRLLIQSATEINTNKPLIELIQGKRDILIASDGSKATTKIGWRLGLHKWQMKYITGRSHQPRLRYHNRDTLS